MEPLRLRTEAELEQMEDKAKERPILFNGEMVRAVLEGRKTQTRRVIKDIPYHYDFDGFNFSYTTAIFRSLDSVPQTTTGIKCPFGVPGDRLWVRETFRPMDGFVQYKSDLHVDWVDAFKWKPSIHLPRWASRILLEITGVWVERLNDMMPESVHKEGMPDSVYFSEDPSAPMDWFESLWNSINEKRGLGWDTNPWVWVVEFKVVSK